MCCDKTAFHSVGQTRTCKLCGSVFIPTHHRQVFCECYSKQRNLHTMKERQRRLSKRKLKICPICKTPFAFGGRSKYCEKCHDVAIKIRQREYDLKKHQIILKHCIVCGNEFVPVGYQKVCLDCRDEYRKKWMRNYYRNYWKKNPIKYAKLKLQVRAWQLSHPDRVKEYNAKNQKYYRDYHRNWRNNTEAGQRYLKNQIKKRTGRDRISRGVCPECSTPLLRAGSIRQGNQMRQQLKCSSCGHRVVLKAV